MILILLAGLACAFAIHFLVYDGAPDGIPRVGKAGGIGYLIAALRFAIKSEEVLEDAERTFGGRTYAVPTLSGWLIVLSAEHIAMLRTSNDSVFNEPIFVNEFLQLDHIMNDRVQRAPFQVNVVRNQLTKGIANLIPEIVDEATLAIEDTFKPPPNSEYARLPVFDTAMHMFGRIMNRATVGVEICRDEHFVRTIVRFMNGLIIYSWLLRCLPNVPGLRAVAFFVLSSIWGSSKQAKAFIKPYIAKRLAERKVSDDSPFNLAELLIHNAPPEVAEDADDLAMRIIYLNVGGLYPPAVYLSQTLFEMAQMSAEDIDSVREEVKTVLEQEGGWTKMGLDKFVKIDSILREVGRIHGVACCAMGRITVAAGTLLDGVVIPPGYQVVVNLKHFHRDARVYPNPYAFEPFRFSRLRETEDSGVKYGFTTVDDHFLSFGAGRHACPGRFFASMQLKIIVAMILLDYEVKLPDGKLTRPRDLIFDGFVIPPLTEQLLFKPRLGKKGDVLLE